MAEYPYPDKCGCCTTEPKVPCNCDPAIAGASIKLTGSDLPGGEFSFDVAKSEDGIAVPFDVTIKLVKEIDMARAGQGAFKNNAYGDVGYGLELFYSVVLYWEWDQMIHIDRFIRVWGTVQFPTEPYCEARVSYAVQFKIDGEQNGLLQPYSALSPQSDRIASQATCSKFWRPEQFHHNIVTTECSGWNLTPDPVAGGECRTMDGEIPLREPKPIKSLTAGYNPYPGGGQFVWNACPGTEGDSKSVTILVGDKWTDNSGNPLGLGLFVYHSSARIYYIGDTIDFCIADEFYTEDNRFNLTIEVEFYGI